MMKRALCFLICTILACSAGMAADPTSTGNQEIDFYVMFRKKGSNDFYFFDPDEQYSGKPSEVREFGFGYYSGSGSGQEQLEEKIGVYYSIKSADSFSIELDFSSLAYGSSGTDSSGFMLGHIDKSDTGLNYSVYEADGVELKLDNSGSRGTPIPYDQRHLTVDSGQGNKEGTKTYLLSLPVENGFAYGQYRGYVYMTLSTY